MLDGKVRWFVRRRLFTLTFTGLAGERRAGRAGILGCVSNNLNSDLI